MDNKLFWLAIKNVRGIGEITIKKLITEYGTVEDCFKSISNNSVKEKALKQAETELKKIEKLRANIITYNDIEYPQKLKDIYSPPPVLYYFGNIDILKKDDTIAVVGSRNPTDYGKNSCAEITSDIAKMNICTVSGLARGIDTIVHKETLNNGSDTIAVLGSGIDVVYPASNKQLFNEIRKKGLIISEFPIGTKPEPGNFPKRNRIISALAKGVVIIEASMKSGSLITAEFALNQGKDVFALPGSIYSYKSKGTHHLIKNGAYLIENAKDIIETLFPYKIAENRHTQENVKEPQFDSKELETIFKRIREKPTSIDELVTDTGFKINEISGLLSNLQILGYIKELKGKIYVSNV